MPLIEYKSHTFRKQSRAVIEQASSIIAEYLEQGYDLTLRQLYYQFVARDILPNNQKEYDRLGRLIRNAREAGLIDWDAIVDRTRSVQANAHFRDPGDILTEAANQYRLNTRASQDTYVEVWVEKEALLGVVGSICEELDVTCLACKGYFSLSAMWRASERIGSAVGIGKKAVVLHLGDHDPSGLDMTRDIRDRLKMFLGVGANFAVDRVALNIEQIQELNPPPNPAKEADTRSADYVSRYGYESWELDALDPKIITKLIRDSVAGYTDEDRRQELINRQEQQKQSLAHIADHWQEAC